MEDFSWYIIFFWLAVCFDYPPDLCSIFWVVCLWYSGSPTEKLNGDTHSIGFLFALLDSRKWCPMAKDHETNLVVLQFNRQYSKFLSLDINHYFGSTHLSKQASAKLRLPEFQRLLKIMGEKHGFWRAAASRRKSPPLAAGVAHIWGMDNSSLVKKVIQKWWTYMKSKFVECAECIFHRVRA